MQIIDTLMMDSSLEDSDEVVYECDAYISKAFDESLYLFGYPKTSPNERIAEGYECLSAKFKPNQQKIEMEMGINIHSNSYNMDKAETIAVQVDGSANSGEAFFKNPFMDKYIISGSRAITSRNNYSLGYWKDGHLTLTPFHSILELSSNLIQMDKMQAKTTQNTEEDDEEEAVAVTVRFEGANADRNKELREKSYHFQSQKWASEPWIDLNYHPLGSNRSKLESQKLIGQMYNPENCSFISKEEYLKMLVPECLRQSENNSLNDEENQIMTNKTLSDQMKHLLKNAHIMTFSMLMKKLSMNIDDASVERLLHQFAVLVRGCWAVKSELLYPDNYVSPYTGLNAKLLENARDYVLWLFTQSPFITRKDVLSHIQLPHEDFISMITPLAKLNNKRWEFKFPDDKDFIESHPEIAERQQMKWDLRYKKLVKDLNIGMNEPEGSPSKVTFMTSPRPRQKRHSRSSQSEGDESGTEHAYGTKDFNKTKRMCSKKNTAASPTKMGTKSKSFQFPTLNISPTFLESSPPPNLLSELKEYVGDIIRNHYCMTYSDIKELVSQSHLNDFSNRSDFDQLLESALLASGAQKVKNKWPQNTAPEALYAFTKFGNKYDRYRNALLDLFSVTARVRQNLLMQKVKDVYMETMTETDCKIIFEEYCVHKSGFYYLKGTIIPDPS